VKSSSSRRAAAAVASRGVFFVNDLIGYVVRHFLPKKAAQTITSGG